MKEFHYINQLQFSIVRKTALSYNLLYFVCQLDALRRYVLLLFYRNEVRLSWIEGGKQLAYSLTKHNDSLMSNINVLY